MSEPRYPALDVRRYLKHLTGCSAYNEDEQACDCGVLRAEAKLEELTADAERMARQFDAQRDLLTRLAGALVEYVKWKGAAHEADCAMDDTCGCAAKPVNDAVNAALAEARAAGVVTE